MHRILTAALAAVAIAIVAPPRSAAQQVTASTEALRVFLDCNVCDQDHVRREIEWVEWVRDRQDSDVHVLVTTQSTGGGGRVYELTILGRGPLAGKADTLTANVPAAVSSDGARSALIQKLALGLAGHAAHTADGDRLRIVVAGAEAEAEDADGETGDEAGPIDDPWNAWVFSISGRGLLNGESQQSFRNVSGSLSARRITEQWKFTFGVNGSENHSEFTLTDGVATSTRRNYGANMLLVKSMGPNWSTGILASGNSASFVNQDLALRTAPAIEYNVFPYDESTRRRLTLRYSVGPSFVDYSEETIFGRISERLLQHQLLASIALQQPWGRVSGGVEFSHYLGWSPAPTAVPELSTDDVKYSATVNTSLDLRLVRGLSLTLSANYQRIHDQIYLARGGASDQDVLLRIRQLQTNYRYFGSVGLRYTFGSIYNSVVNPRFGGTSGGGMVIMM